MLPVNSSINATTDSEPAWACPGRHHRNLHPCSDRADVFNVALWGRENREDTIYRSKAVREPPFMLGISALLALSDAVSACGADYPALDAPATAERVLMAVNRVRRP